MNHIPFISQHYTVRHTFGAECVIKCGGQIITGGRFNDGSTREENFELASRRAYQLNRARNL